MNLFKFIKGEGRKRHILSDSDLQEINAFYMMLLKMKKKRTAFNADAVMNKLYPNYKSYGINYDKEYRTIGEPD